MKCPDCNHEADEHVKFNNETYECIGSGRCKCQKTPKDVYEALLNEARQVIAPFAEDSKLFDNNWKDESEAGNHINSKLTVGDLRKASAFLAKIGNGDME